MSKAHRKTLFDHHWNDLQGIIPDIDKIFVCPICFGIFPEEDIEDDNKLSVGHVWPAAFRERSEESKHHQVLLCYTCNSLSGSAGDSIMQEDLTYFEAEVEGKPELRDVIISFGLSKEPIYLKLYIKSTGEKDFVLGLPKYRKKSSREHFGKQWEKFKEYSKSEKFSLTVFPPRGKPSMPFGHPTNGPLVQAGLLTSAYLMAFFTYGYTYILQTCLEPVREYIRASHGKRVDDRLDFAGYKSMCVWKCTHADCFSEIPFVHLVMPLNDEEPIHQEVRFLYYHMRMPTPIQFDNENEQVDWILSNLGLEQIPTINGQIPQSLSSEQMVISNMDHTIINTLLEEFRVPSA